MPIQKCESYDADVIDKLLIHDGISEEEKATLRKYKKRKVNGHQVQITYDYTDKGANRSMQKGRLYPTPWNGLATFKREVRAALAGAYYDEIDMENSQPVLLAQICDKMNVKNDALNEYVEKRSEVLAAIQQTHKLERDDAKSICIAVAFGGLREQHPLLPKMKRELDILASEVVKAYPEYLTLAKKSKEAKGKGGDLVAAALSQYAQDQETKILLVMDSFLETKGYSMDVLQHDGGDVRRKDGQPLPMTVLREAEGVILEKTGFKTTWTIKPLVHTFDFTPKDTSKILSNNILVNDSWAAEQLVKVVGDRLRMVGNELYCKLDSGVWEAGDWGIRKLIEAHEKQLVWKQMNEMGMIRIHDYGGDVTNISKLIKQTYMKAVPGELPVQFCYRDVESDGEEHEDVVQVFLSLLKILCGNDALLSQYTLKWIAHIIQKPYELAGVMIILSGAKGAGKDTLFDFLFAYVFGGHSSYNYSSNTQFFEKHDTGRMGKFIVKLEEADRKACLDHKSDLKAMVTCSEATFNPKLEKQVKMPNYCRHIQTTNTGNPVDFGDGERRFVILPCSSEKKGDLVYWTMVRKTLFNPQAGRVIGQYLETVDLSGFNVRELPPNEYQDDVVETEVRAEQRFVEWWDGNEKGATELFEEFRNYCRAHELIGASNSSAFGKSLLRMIGEGIVIKKRTATGVRYKKPGATPPLQITGE